MWAAVPVPVKNPCPPTLSERHTTDGPTTGFGGGVPRLSSLGGWMWSTRRCRRDRNACAPRGPTRGGRRSTPGGPERLTRRSTRDCERSSWRGSCLRLSHGPLDPEARGQGHREGVRGGVHRVGGLARPSRPRPIDAGPGPPGPGTGRGVHSPREEGRVAQDPEGGTRDQGHPSVPGRELRPIGA